MTPLGRKAREFARRDAWKEGRLFFERAVRREPLNAEAHAHLGFFCVKESLFDTRRGLAEYKAALRLDPDCAAAYVYRAVTLGTLLKVREAREALRMASRRGAAPRDLTLAEGCLELDAGSVDKAIRHFRRLVDLERDSTGMILLSQAYSQAGRNEEALSWARKAFAMDPKDFRAPVYMGVYLAYLRRFAEADKAIHRALAMKRDFALSHHTLAYLAEKRGSAKAAERHLRTALKIDPEYVTSRKMLADLCAKSGRIKEAGRHYKLALERFPDYKEAREALRRLE